MRKPRDFDAELKALEDKARALKARKVMQLGELVIATGADALTPEELAGALVALAETKDRSKRDAWVKRGEAFFAGRQRSRPERSAPSRDAAPRQTAATSVRDGDGALPLDGGASSPSRVAGAP